MRDLAEAVAKKKVILFAGGGVSAALGLPTHEEILQRLAQDLEIDPVVFMSLGDYRQLAEYYLLEKGSLGGLRRWFDIEQDKLDIDVCSSMVHKTIVDLDFPIIYTTNYDRLLERAFEASRVRYTKVCNVRDLLDIKSGATQIIKFHGDFDDDNSLVFAESAYLERLELEGPLDIKLRADTLGKSILFIGYSLSDIN
ncbi:MAG: SIR2 family protein, partial [Terriglobales bacterium]